MEHNTTYVTSLNLRNLGDNSVHHFRLLARQLSITHSELFEELMYVAWKHWTEQLPDGLGSTRKEAWDAWLRVRA